MAGINEETPFGILRTKRGRYRYITEPPCESDDYVWYMRDLLSIPLADLPDCLRKLAHRRWYATDKTSYRALVAAGATKASSVGETEGDGDAVGARANEPDAPATGGGDEEGENGPLVLLRRQSCDGQYWIGTRVARTPKHLLVCDRPPVLIVSVAEMYLKSAMHRRSMMQQLLTGMRRILEGFGTQPSPTLPSASRLPSSPPVMDSGFSVAPCGYCLVEIRGKTMPSETAMRLLSLLPGVGKVYRAVVTPPSAIKEGHTFDPRGEVLCDGAGGIPISRELCVLVLLSGGIDSPVAAYKMMVRGCSVSCVHFLNSSSDTGAVIAKNQALAQRLSQVQGFLSLRFVDIRAIQSQIVAKIPNHNRTVLYKWTMLFLAGLMATGKHGVSGANRGPEHDEGDRADVGGLRGEEEGGSSRGKSQGGGDRSDGEDEPRQLSATTDATTTPLGKLVVVGDALGQVASQTLDNIAALYRAAGTVVLAPLMGANKTDIVAVANHVGTLEASSVAASDCCQYMMCKTGANLNVSLRTLRKCVALLTLDGLRLPVRVEHYFNGALQRSEEEELSVSLADCDLAQPGRSWRPRHRRGEEEEHGEVAQHSEMKTEEPERQPPTGKRAESDAEGGAYLTAVEAAAQLGKRPPLSEAQRRPLYFDAASGTAVHPDVLQAMLTAPHANPNALHQSALHARMAIELVRSDLAAVVGLPSSDIIFTSGGTESNNLALNGYHVVNRAAWMHASTVGTESLRPGVLTLGSVAVVDLVNHETGIVCPPEGLQRPPNATRLHVDACQALLKIDFKSLDLSAVDTMSFSAHKINGPLGLGMLYVRNLSQALKDGTLLPLVQGGDHEAGARPGTENVSAIVGLGVALKLKRPASQHRAVHARVVQRLTELGLTVNGCSDVSNSNSSTNSQAQIARSSGFICHATLPEGFHHVDVVSTMSAVHGVEVGTGAACKSGKTNDGVYETLNIHPIPRNRSLRFSWDHFTTVEDAETMLSALQATLQSLRKAGGGAAKQ